MRPHLLIATAILAASACGGSRPAPAAAPSASEPAAGQPSASEPATEGSQAAESADAAEQGAPAAPAERPPLEGTVVLWCRGGDGAGTEQCEPPKEGLLEAKPLLAVLQRREPELRECVAEPGAVRVRVRIDGEGAVTEVQLPETALGEDEQKCIRDAVSGWGFPAPGDGEVVLEYPFELGQPVAS